MSPPLSPRVYTRVYSRLRVASAASAAIARAVAIGFIAAAIVAAGARDIDFAADNRLHAARGRLVVEVFGGKKIAVIGDGHGGDGPAGPPAHPVAGVVGAARRRISRWYVKMFKKA